MKKYIVVTCFTIVITIVHLSRFVWDHLPNVDHSMPVLKEVSYQDHVPTRFTPLPILNTKVIQTNSNYKISFISNKDIEYKTDLFTQYLSKEEDTKENVNTTTPNTKEDVTQQEDTDHTSSNHEEVQQVPIIDIQLININTASLELLDTLPGIGPSKAKAIMDYRIANGPFHNVEDLLLVPKIGVDTFNQIVHLITI